MKTLFLLAVCHAAAFAQGALPNPALTPGAVLTTDRNVICKAGYSKTVRNVPGAVKRAVYRSYLIHCKLCGKTYEVDHLISLELGGSNDQKNLWPQRYSPEPGAHQKDLLENAMRAEVCSGKLDLKEAQRAIADDWRAEYQARFGRN